MGSAFSQQQYVVAKPPTGRLTLTTGTPVMSAEAAAQTTIYYTPYVGSMVPVYDGTGWRERTFAELSLALAGSANWVSGSNYDLFIVDDGGTLRLLTGPAWTNDTTRSTAISLLNGLWVNDASMTGRYGAASTMTVAQYRGLYVGTVRMSASGTTTWELGGDASGGDPIKLYLWNCYNRVSITKTSADTAVSWTYNSATVRAAGGGAGIYADVVSGLAEGSLLLVGLIRLSMPANHYGFFGIGVDTSSSMSKRSLVYAIGGVAVDGQYPCVFHTVMSLGRHYYYLTEQGDGGGINYTAYSSSSVDNGITVTAEF